MLFAMKPANIGPTIVVAMPLKMKPTKRMSGNSVLLAWCALALLPLRSGHVCAKHLKQQPQRTSRGKDRDYVGRNSCTLFVCT